MGALGEVREAFRPRCKGPVGDKSTEFAMRSLTMAWQIFPLRKR